jgi:uncharacterized membrane protein
MVRVVKGLVAVSLSFVALDLIWLGLVASDFYNDNLGPLRAEEVVWSAAILFYVQYLVVVLVFAVLPSVDLKSAARRGALIGWIGYATYELTNWAVIEGWPSELVMVDIVWGVCLTAAVATAGRAAAGAPTS